ncbi:hypothetical protein NE865_05347 [Phthorimaea operculella]|nr:hypothetical protein NE865_05347 [Phthorimaea operculella]
MMQREKSASDPDVSRSSIESTSPNFVNNTRNIKRKREEVTVADFDDFKEEIKNMLSSLEVLKNVMPTLQNIELTNINIQVSVDYLTKQNEELKKQIIDLESQAKEDKKRITLLEDKIEDLQRGQRKTNLEIKNVPKRANETKEDLLELVTCLATNIGCSVDKSDVKDIYRVRSKKADAVNTSIVVETNSNMLKTDIIKMSKQFNMRSQNKLCAKHLGFRTAEDTPIFVSEHLTPRSARLHFLARELAKTKAYKFCWTAHGKIYVRKTDNSPIISITNEAQVHQLMMFEK